MPAELVDKVGDLLREAAAAAILPRFQRLADGDIEEKMPGELVTIADREAETLIAQGLSRLRPAARIVGEEGCATDPRLLDRLGDGTVWLIDPLDGTGNFAAGRTPFSVMVALLEEGETVAAWMLDPVTGGLAIAERGSGAFLNGRRIETAHGSPGASDLRGAVFSRFMPTPVSQKVLARTGMLRETLPGLMCAGAEYPAVAAGEQHFALFWRTLPWDHAPGVLFLNEAGGKAARLDGSRYRAASTDTGLLVAQNADIWDDAHAALLQ